ncbi:MAG: RidA family protein [Polyangiales bacterium]
MKQQLAALTTLLATSVPSLALAVNVPEVKRVKSATANAPILAGVLVPANVPLYYLSGQVPAPIDPSKPATGIESYGDTKAQAVSVFKKIEALLVEQGLALKDVVKLTVYLVGDPKLGNKLDFKGFSEAYAQYFGTAEQPNIVARTTVQVAALANPAYLVEIEAVAAVSAGAGKKAAGKPAPAPAK